MKEFAETGWRMIETERTRRLYVDMMESRMTFKPLPLVKVVDALNAAGVETRTAGGFWGGVTPNGEIVVTSWTGIAFSWPAPHHGVSDFAY